MHQRRITLENEESRWHKSWTRDPKNEANLEAVLASTTSYGFSFVGLAYEVTGKLSLGSFEIQTA